MSPAPAPPQRPPSVELKAALAAAIGSTLVGSLPMLALGLYATGMNVTSVLFWRYWLALLVLAPLAWWTSPSLRDDWRHAGRGLFVNAITLGMVQTYTYFRAVQGMPSSIVITIFFTYPVMTLVLDRVFFGKRPGSWSALAALLVFAGAALAGWPTLSLDISDKVALACAIATPLVFSVYIAIAYRFTRQASAFAGGAFIYLGLGTAYALVSLVAGLQIPVGSGSWLRVAAIALVGGVIQISAFAYALPRLSASGYSIIVSMELVTVVCLGVVVLGEHLSLLQTAGIVLVLTGIIIDRLLRSR